MRPQEQHRDGDHRKVFTAKATRVVAIGASMGGVEALEQILSQYPEDCPATLIVQHIPDTMGQAFAQRLDKACKAQVCVAENGMILRRGLVLLAPGGMHMVLRSKADQFYVLIKDGPRFNYHKPSVDVLFRSVARNAGKSAVGVLLTGMGSDGASGLKLMRDSGAATIAQDEKTSLIYGMPKAAVDQGAAQHVLPLQNIARKITALCTEKQRTSRTVPVDVVRDISIPGIPDGALKPLWMGGALFKVDYRGKKHVLFN